MGSRCNDKPPPVNDELNGDGLTLSDECITHVFEDHSGYK